MSQAIQSDDRRLQGAMTVKDILVALEDMDPKAYPFFTVDYGDRGHTMQALPIQDIQLASDEGKIIVRAAYSASEMAVRDPDDDEPVAAGNDFNAVLFS